MDSTNGILNWNNGLVLILGWALAVGVLYVLLNLIRSKRHGGTVSAISVPGLFVVLGCFCVSTPKINSLLLQYGENHLRIGELEKDIETKQDQLTALNKIMETRSVERDLADVAKAKTSGKQIYETHSKLIVSPAVVASVLKRKVEGISPEYWLIEKSQSGEIVNEATAVNDVTGQKRTMMLDAEKKKALGAVINAND